MKNASEKGRVEGLANSHEIDADYAYDALDGFDGEGEWMSKIKDWAKTHRIFVGIIFALGSFSAYQGVEAMYEHSTAPKIAQETIHMRNIQLAARESFADIYRINEIGETVHISVTSLFKNKGNENEGLVTCEQKGKGAVQCQRFTERQKGDEEGEYWRISEGLGGSYKVQQKFVDMLPEKAYNCKSPIELSEEAVERYGTEKERITEARSGEGLDTGSLAISSIMADTHGNNLVQSIMQSAIESYAVVCIHGEKNKKQLGYTPWGTKL